MTLGLCIFHKNVHRKKFQNVPCSLHMISAKLNEDITNYNGEYTCYYLLSKFKKIEL